MMPVCVFPSGPGPTLLPTKESTLANKESEGAVESKWGIVSGVFVFDHIIFCILPFLCYLSRITSMIVLPGPDGWDVYPYN